MSGADAEALVSRTLGAGERLCGVFYRRADGSVMTQDCPVGLAAVKARFRRRTARIAAAFGLLATGSALAAANTDSVRLRGMRPFSIIVARLFPTPLPLPPVGRMVMGEIACPVAPPPAPPPTSSPAPEPSNP